MKLSVTNKRWIYEDPNYRQVQTLIQKHELPDSVARILVRRGFDCGNIDSFLNPKLKDLLPNPLNLLDMEKAVSRMIIALQNQEKIIIFGDYDVDGATSSSLLLRFLKPLTPHVSFYIPDRITEGYGPSLPAFDTFLKEGVKLIITVDCGTAAHAPLAFAKDNGMDVIVFDHHVAESKLPEAYALVNPNRLDEISETSKKTRHLAAVGVSFLFATALSKRIKTDLPEMITHLPDLLSLLDLVALGTVCDVMPLTGLNRAFVKQGLKVINLRKNIGLKALADIAGLNETPSTYHLGFLLGPRINAGGRVGASDLGTRLLTTPDHYEAQKISTELNHLNQERQDIEAVVLEEALQLAELQQNHPVLFLAHAGWHEGVIGIVAGRLKDRFQKPTFIVALNEGVGKGSARSIPGFDVGTLIHNAHHRGLLLGGGGHAMAGGVSVTIDQIPEFHNYLNESYLQLSENTDFSPFLEIDGILGLHALKGDILDHLEKMMPFGVGNPSPKFLFEGVRLKYWKIVGENHLSLQLSQDDRTTFKAMAFRSLGTPLGELLQKNKGEPLDFVATLKRDTWGGRNEIQLMVEDVRASVYEAQKLVS
ncbi:Single-stranded-DNA-specific exonuclease RecJ [Candidatus Bealeia paramacronuclearis]|uniref:Single-stranded-DNA-specific exonuclease RecJ n=1 Tax=Candidatus Bealeia paramacronuclearis TaxID=1921001 RepID=A0ABZ2C5H2_9PROT|nr:Single-stranded-DNA-specific exonuclease RecJ [Candidatus Bealeia paramacronuclearis]